MRFLRFSQVVQIRFRDNHLYTFITIIGASELELDALIDTGSTQTCIPLESCSFLGLESVGTGKTLTANGEAFLPIFNVSILIGDRRFDSIEVKGLSSDVTLLGIDLLQKYKISIDWLSSPQVATAKY